MNAKPAIEAVDLVKTYYGTKPAVRAINGLSFSVHQGEVFAVVGPNGCGKTTTFNLFAYLTTPEEGQLSVIGERPGTAAYTSQISFVSCETQYLWVLTAAQILSFYAHLRSADRPRLDTLVERFNFGGLLSRRWSQLSSGEKMKLRLLKALLSAPRVLFLDEPTVGLDPDAADQFRGILKELKREGCTIVLTSHLMRDVEALADRILFLKEGRKICEGPTGDFMKASDTMDVRLSTRLADIPDFLSELEDGYFRLRIADLRRLLAIAEVEEVRAGEGGLEGFFIRKAREVHAVSEEG